MSSHPKIRSEGTGDDGLVYYPQDKLMTTAAELLEVERARIEPAMALLVEQRS